MDTSAWNSSIASTRLAPVLKVRTTCPASSMSAAMLERWMHHYNWHRPHQGIKGFAPATRLAQSRNNLSTLHS